MHGSMQGTCIGAARLSTAPLIAHRTEPVKGMSAGLHKAQGMSFTTPPTSDSHMVLIPGTMASIQTRAAVGAARRVPHLNSLFESMRPQELFAEFHKAQGTSFTTPPTAESKPHLHRNSNSTHAHTVMPAVSSTGEACLTMFWALSGFLLRL